jgi:hypothetical protein
MKVIYKSISIAFILIISASCAKEEMIKADPDFILSFQRDGMTDALAGSPFYIIPNGSGEFLTLFDGTEGHVWGEPDAKGTDFNKADSVSLQYNTAGVYTITLLSTSSGDFGKEVSRNAKSVEINVVDERNAITLFIVNETEGLISSDNEITFSVPDIFPDFNFIATFSLQSKLAKAFVNGVEQESGVTVNNFAQPIVYTVRSAQGNEQQYTVKFSTFPPSSEKQLTAFSLGLGGNGEIGSIDEANKTINIIANYGSNVKLVRLALSSSYTSNIYLNNVLYSDRKSYDISSTGINSIKVVAQDKSEISYAINVTSEDPVSSFTFSGLVPAPVGEIDKTAKTISIDVLKGTDITKLVAAWTGSVGTVKVGAVTQTNGISINNFTSPVTYTFYKGTTAGDKYVVTVKVK